MCSHALRNLDCNVSSPPTSMKRMVSCGVSCSTPGLRSKAAVGAKFPKPTSARYGPSGKINLQQHVDRWTFSIDCHTTYHSTLQAGDVVTEGAQALSEEHVLFQAIAASTADYHLTLKRCQIEPWRPPKHDVERLIGNGMRVGQNELMQCTEGRFERTIISNALQPSTLIKLCDHLKPSTTLRVLYRRSGSCSTPQRGSPSPTYGQVWLAEGGRFSLRSPDIASGQLSGRLYARPANDWGLAC